MRILKTNWIATYMQYTTHSEAPDTFHFWTAVSMIGAALRRKVWVDMGNFEWTPNFYIILVAPPGIAQKSTSINMGVEIAKEIKDIKFGPTTITWQSLPGELRNVGVFHQMPDGTQFPMACLNFAVSELGNFLDPKNTPMVDFLVQMWDGQKDIYRKVTKMSGNDEVVNPWVNIIAAVTPDWLSENLPRSMLGGGFVSRCLFVFASRKRQRIAYPQRQMQDYHNWKAQYFQALVHDLEEISKLTGEFKLTDEAYDLGEEWYEKHCDRIEKGNVTEFGGYLSRKQASVHKLAMVFSASESDRMLIERKHLETSIQFHDGLEADYGTVFQKIHTTMSSEKLDRISSTIESNPTGITKSNLWQAFYYHFQGYREFEETINGIIGLGRVEVFLNGSEVVYKPKRRP